MRRIALIGFTLVYALSSGLFIDSVSAQTMTDRQIEIIRANCDTAQVDLQKLQQSDLATRISRGRGYEQLLKLMTVFNSRTVLNQYDASDMTAVTADFEAEFRQFQRDYITYSEHLSETIEMQCQDQPVTFYDELALVRQQRIDLGRAVIEMERLLDEYGQEVDMLRQAIDQDTKESNL